MTDGRTQSGSMAAACSGIQPHFWEPRKQWGECHLGAARRHDRWFDTCASPHPSLKDSTGSRFVPALKARYSPLTSSSGCTVQNNLRRVGRFPGQHIHQGLPPERVAEQQRDKPKSPHGCQKFHRRDPFGRLAHYRQVQNIRTHAGPSHGPVRADGVQVA